MYYGYPHPFFVEFIPFLLFLLIIFLVWRLISYLFWKNNWKENFDDQIYSDKAIDILKERFVRGEIDEKDFEYRLMVLRRNDKNFDKK